jgi:hypothetical protein
MKQVLVMLLSVFSVNLLAESVVRVPTLLADGERGDYVPQLVYEVLGVSINSSTFKVIESKLGKTTRYKGEHTANHICYVNGVDMIEFTISSLGFGYEVSHTEKPNPKCTVIADPIENRLGMKVGMSKQDVIRLLGKPSETKKDGVSYTYWIQELPDQSTQATLPPEVVGLWLDTYSYINILFKNNMLTEFSLYTTETY